MSIRLSQELSHTAADYPVFVLSKLEPICKSQPPQQSLHEQHFPNGARERTKCSFKAGPAECLVLHIPCAPSCWVCTILLGSAAGLEGSSAAQCLAYGKKESLGG